jgi:hypothetical protein
MIEMSEHEKEELLAWVRLHKERCPNSNSWRSRYGPIIVSAITSALLAAVMAGFSSFVVINSQIASLSKSDETLQSQIWSVDKKADAIDDRLSSLRERVDRIVDSFIGKVSR